jgi:hydrophobe/amphiphile efflux-1 (HAE1) family protein
MKGNIFIKRPVMALSISVLILIVGFISLYTLPVEQYPDIAPPTVRVEATYTGVNADAVMNSVIMPLEESINGVENMIYITSTATNAGTAEILVYFKQGTDPDMAAVNVQNRVSAAQGLLPSEVTAIGVSTMKRQNSFLQINSLISPDKRYDETFLANYLDINVIPQVKRIQGVGDVQLMGDTYSMRIWMKPDKMAQYGLVPSDVTAVLGEQNTEAPTGSLGESSDNVFQYTMKYKGRLKSVEEFENMVIRSQKDGSVLRVKDIAEVELGRESYSFHGEADGVPGVTFMVFQVAGANATAVNQEISDLLDDISKDLPEGTEFIQMMSVNDFLFASIDNVVETLVIAIILVVLVVYFFLHDFKSTLIPSISIIVSLIGTFAFLSVAGFSINILTLFALVLAIGTVVDDAIIVVEAVQAKFDVGYRSSYLATKDAMSDVTMAVVSCTFVFMAVFIPVTFMGGTSGVFYTQFGITMAVAVGLSCINALTLCPALCAMMMKASDTEKSIKSFSGRIRAADGHEGTDGQRAHSRRLPQARAGQRAPAGPAGRRHRRRRGQHLLLGGAVRRRHRSAPERRHARPRGLRAAGRHHPRGAAARAGRRRLDAARLPRRARHGRRLPAAGAGLRPRGPALPGLRHAGAAHRAGPARHLSVSALPAPDAVRP